MVAGVEPVAVLGGQIETADEGDPVVDHDRLLVVAVHWALMSVERNLRARAVDEPVAHRPHVGPGRAEEWKWRAGPAQHANLDALGELREKVAKHERVSVAHQREGGREVPAGKVDVRLGLQHRLGDRGQNLGAVDQHVDLVAAAR